MWRQLLKLKLAAAYKKDLQLIAARGYKLNLLRAPLSLLLTRQPLSPQYRDHPLKGNWVGHREFHIQGDWILIYRIEDEEKLVLVRTGTHSDLLKI
jgi:mRNA interferase YafQ